MKQARRVAVAMSGGVDSSVAAALLQERGEDVFGVMLRLWGGKGGANRCCAPEDVETARGVAALIGIPFYVLDARSEFHELVVEPFLDGYAKGITPNPCIECNRSVRWGYLLRQALAMGATHLATGHYARIGQGESGSLRLLEAADAHKDQSYVLHMLTQSQLARALFPIGEMTKEEVRDYARRRRLSVADRRESQDLCFAGGDYRTFLREMGVESSPGRIVDSEGEVLGEHSGLADYTIGQRKGLRLSAREPLYVIDKRLESNTLVVGPRRFLGRTGFDTQRVNWISGQTPAGPIEAEVQVRYRARRVPGSIVPSGADTARLLLQLAQPDITAGQSAVFYRQGECLGGGIIQA